MSPKTRRICATWEIGRRVRHRAHLSDDEFIVLAMVAAQISLAQYVEPHRELHPDDTLKAILDILDRGEVVQAVSSKMLWLLNHRPPARLNQPAGSRLDDFDTLTKTNQSAVKRVRCWRSELICVRTFGTRQQRLAFNFRVCGILSI